MSQTFKNGKLNGKIFENYENGKIHFSGFYKNDLKDGEWIYFYDNGTVKIKESWKENKLVDVSDFFSSKGKVIGKKTFKDGTGSVKYFYDSGKPLSLISYKKGIKEGISKTFSKTEL